MTRLKPDMIRTLSTTAARCSVTLECAKCLIFHEGGPLLCAKPDMIRT